MAYSRENHCVCARGSFCLSSGMKIMCASCLLFAVTTRMSDLNG